MAITDEQILAIGRAARDCTERDRVIRWHCVAALGLTALPEWYRDAPERRRAESMAWLEASGLAPSPAPTAAACAPTCPCALLPPRDYRGPRRG